MIEISCEQIERVETLLAGVPDGAPRAVANAMNRGLSKLKAESFRRVKQVYTVKAPALNEATKVSIKKANAGDLQGEINFAGTKIPLYKFQVTPTQPSWHQLVTAAVKKGAGGTLPHAFIAGMQSGHTGVFERVSETRLPVEEKMGLSAAQMISNEDVMDGLEDAAQEVVNKRLEHEIERLLAGYGG
jgi:hypothetical protein